MKDRIKKSLHKLSSKRIMKRKEAIKELARLIHHHDAHLARLSLQYVSEHDPAYTVRNLARQAFYRIGNPDIIQRGWEKTYAFHDRLRSG
ncbi:hypothetical protein GF318_03970 [Candidatus Micrarchaeota archaeon]|nr:hypothetical protein [Candidatus Micrarchaeota archaeon]